MIRKLQKKFVLAAMLSLLIVLALLIGVINALNYASMVRDADGTLALLAANDGTFQMPLGERGNGQQPDDVYLSGNTDNGITQWELETDYSFRPE